METIAKGIVEYELIDHGIDGSQYFQGCGTAFTDYEHCVTGCGSNAAEALGDALEQMASSGHDVDFEALEAGMLADNDFEAWPTSPTPCDDCERADEPEHDVCQGCELYYYVSIRFNLAD